LLAAGCGKQNSTYEDSYREVASAVFTICGLVLFKLMCCLFQFTVPYMTEIEIYSLVVLVDCP
jgi:hypothetical protein